VVQTAGLTASAECTTSCHNHRHFTRHSSVLSYSPVSASPWKA